MSAEPTHWISSIEHDHTRLDVLFEDLRAIARHAIASDADPELLEDARAQWGVLREDIVRHFNAEERKVFGPLEAAQPELRQRLAGLMEQHDRLRRELTAIGRILESPRSLPQKNPELEKRWTDFEVVWQEHSATEWEILESTRATALSPAGDQALPD